MITKEQYLEAAEVVKNYKLQLQKELESIQIFEDSLVKNANVTPDTDIMDANLSVRLFNVLVGYYFKPAFPGKSIYDFKIHHLSHLSEKQFLSFRSVGKKYLKELRELCHCAGVKLRKD
jgi:hypothetical protein